MSAADRLTDEEKAELVCLVDRAATAAIAKAAVTWGMPLVDILNSEGHDHDCDAVTGENLTLCDCWWGRVRDASRGMSAVATLAEEATSVATDDLPTTPGERWRMTIPAALNALAARPAPDACGCEPCPGRGTDGHGREHCAECCFGTQAAYRPASDTLAAHVQALAEKWEGQRAEWARLDGLSGTSERDDYCRIAEGHAKDLRALLAGRPDASPEGGEQRG